MHPKVDSDFGGCQGGKEEGARVGDTGRETCFRDSLVIREVLTEVSSWGQNYRGMGKVYFLIPIKM